MTAPTQGLALSIHRAEAPGPARAGFEGWGRASPPDRDRARAQSVRRRRIERRRTHASGSPSIYRRLSAG
jgi:hypothetical protein